MEPFYVGIGNKVSRAHTLTHHSRTQFHRNIVNKHGAKVEILLGDVDWSVAQFWEIRWIKALREAGYFLANLTAGGDGTLGIPSHNRRKVLCLETGELFDSATHAATKFSMSPVTIIDVCNLKYRKSRDHHFIFSDCEIDAEERNKIILRIESECAVRRKRVERNKNDYANVQNGLDRKGRSAAGPIKNSRQVICAEDGFIYPSASAAARYYNVAKSAVIELCLGKSNRKTVGGHRFSYVEERA